MSQTIIEKAKRYDKIIEEIKGLLESIREDKREILEEDITSIFPELQENEDERIRKQLLNWFKGCHWDAIDDGTLKRNDIITWLEKQRNHANFRNKIQIGDKVTRNEDGVLVNLSQLKRVAKPIEEYNITGIGSKNAQGKLGEMIKRKLEMDKQSDKTQGKSAIEAIKEEKVNNQFCVKPVNKVEPKFNVGDIIVNIHYRWDGRHRIRKIVDGKYIFDDGSCIKIKEQNNWELFTNKDEQKFHTKDWIVFNKNKIVFQIKSYNSGYCTLEDTKGKTYYPCMLPTKEDYHLWTIQEDAKPGDILASKDGKSILIFRHFSLDDDDTFASYYSITFSSYYYMQGYDEYNWLNTNFVPATKEQRDLLCQKMKKAGYEYDAKKELLRKIEYDKSKPNFCHHEVDLFNCSEEYRKAYYDGWNNCNQQHSQLKAEQTSIWSEEDERNLQGIIDEIKANKNQAPDYDFATYDRFLSWLKSLKNRYTWKPSNEQMNTLEHYMTTLVCNEHKEVLFGLYNDLKKLRGE